MKNQRIHLSRGDLLFQILVYTVLGLLSLIVLYPLIYVVSASFTSPAALVAGKMYLWPVNPTVSSYKAVLRESRLWIGYKNTIFYTLLGVSINIVMTVLGAYPLSRKDLVGRKVIMTLITFTMFFSGGMIPNYILMVSLGLKDTVASFILPGVISTYYVILMRSFFESVPKELEEAGEIDGLSRFGAFIHVALPMSKPILATMTLFYLVQYWNDWFDAFLYLDTQSKWPVAYYLRNLISTSSSSAEDAGEALTIAANIKSCAMVLTAAPIICVYPFIQKYFVAGMMLGGVKG